MKAFINGKVLIQDKIIEPAQVLFDESIVALGEEIIDDCEVVDLDGKYLFPGFVDVHVHGAAGADVMDATEEALMIMSNQLAKTGVTRFLATTMTMPMPAIYAALKCVKYAIKQNVLQGARLLGVHLEGPYISESYKGAQNVAYIKKPDWHDLEDYLDIIKVITLAVEEDIDYEFIKKNPGVKLSIGHSAATFEQALKTYDLGVRRCTHCFNAMTGLHHRKPGVVGAIFTKPYDTEFIADGIHIHPGLLNTFVNIIGREHAILITDSMRAGGVKKGTYDLGGQVVVVDEYSARLQDGTLAGSILTLDQAIRNMVEHTKLPLEDIIKMATLNPAKSLCDAPDYGAISVGSKADFVVMRNDLSVESTWVEGRCVYTSKGSAASKSTLSRP